MMSLDRYMGKFFYLAVFSCILVTAFMVGCGGGNNPGGPQVVTTPSSVTTVDQSLNAGTASLFGRVVTSNSTPIANIEVKLLVQNISTGNLEDTGRKSLTLTSGEFIFNGLGTGTFILRIDPTSNYLESSKLAKIEGEGAVNTGDFVILAKTPDGTVPTLNLKAQAVDALSGKPLSVAQISVDTGQTTITDAFGFFELYNLASGTRQLIVKQPGLASYTIYFEVNGVTPPNAQSVFINNQTIPINDAANNRVDLTITVPPSVIKINPNIHQSGVLAGTVKKFVLDANNVATSNEEAFAGFEFDVWIINSEGLARKSHTIISKNDGTWRLDNLPPFEDNGSLWFAVPVRTQVQVLQGQTGNAVVFTNSSAEWADRDPVLAYGYKVSANQTTIMDFTVPSFVYSNPLPTVQDPTNAKFTDLLGNTISQATLTGDIQFTWTGPGIVNQIFLEFSRVYKNPSVPVVSKLIKYNANESTDSTTVHVRTLKPADYGLDFGRFTWVTKVVDPNVDYTTISESTLLTIVPSKDDLSPAHGSTIQKNSVATYTISFIAPLDSEATYATMELEYFDPVASVWKQLGTTNALTLTNQAIFSMEFSPNAPVNGNYRWRSRYYYDDGPSLDSEYAEIKFGN